jgi:Cd2+/Zn2+-exporting ATPase
MNALRSIFAALLDDDHRLLVAIGAGVALVLGFALWEWGPESVASTGQGLVWLSLALGSVHGLRAAAESVIQYRPDIDVLMVVGAYLSAAIGHPEEGALLLFMFTLAGALEHRAMGRARDAVTRLSRLMPADAMVRRDNDWVAIEPDALAPGDTVLVRAGETVPADGEILVGRSHLDQSVLTGESLPRAVEPGDEVFAGTLNQHGSLEVRVTRPTTESSLQKILTLVLEAQESRQPLQRVIDRFSTPYAVGVFIAAIATLVGFWLVPTDGTFVSASYRAITLLVVASPCALMIATPTATLCGLSRAARAGVLIKGGEAMERLAAVDKIALDKTGTLTMGQIEVTHVSPIAASDSDQLLELAMGIEQHSTHPIAAAIVRAAREHAISPADVASIETIPGRGVEGTFDGRPVRIGSFEFCEEMLPICFRSYTRTLVDEIRAKGGLPVVVAHGDGAIVIALADTPRPGAKNLVGQLQAVGVGQVSMLTGDHRVIAERLALELGITDVHAQLLPEDKVAEIRAIRARSTGGSLAVVGDGINDAPALAVADVGLAMGGIGADAALETADVILLHDDIDRIPWSIALARRARRIMLANLIFAIAVIATLATLTILGSVPLWMGVLGHEGSTLLVVANSLRLLAVADPG